MPPSRDRADDSSPPVLIVALFLSSACVDGSWRHWLLVDPRHIHRRRRCKRRREVEEVVQPWVLSWKDQRAAREGRVGAHREPFPQPVASVPHHGDQPRSSGARG